MGLGVLTIFRHTQIFSHPSIVPHGLTAQRASHGDALRRPAPSAAAGAAAAAGGGGAEGRGSGPAQRRKPWRAAVARWIRWGGNWRFLPILALKNGVLTLESWRILVLLHTL